MNPMLTPAATSLFVPILERQMTGQGSSGTRSSIPRIPPVTADNANGAIASPMHGMGENWAVKDGVGPRTQRNVQLLRPMSNEPVLCSSLSFRGLYNTPASAASGRKVGRVWRPGANDTARGGGTAIVAYVQTDVALRFYAFLGCERIQRVLKRQMRSNLLSALGCSQYVCVT